MNTQLVEIQPRELKFMFEVKKQSSCSVHLANITDQYIAFKVKTTSPKKYCVRPNVGIIKPKSQCDFTVTMQAQKSAPTEMQCKDKFLIQSTVVPFGTTEEEITPSMFSRDGQKYIDETKLRVVLTIVPSSPEKTSFDEVLNQEASFEKTMPKEPKPPVLLPFNGVVKQEPSYETSIPKDKLQNRVENSSPPDLVRNQNRVENFPPPDLVRNQNRVENLPPPDLVRNQNRVENLPPPDLLRNQNAVEISPPPDLPRNQNGIENSPPSDLVKNQNGVENFPVSDLLMKKMEETKKVKDMEESRSLKITDSTKWIPMKDEKIYADKDGKTKQVEEVEAKLQLTQYIEQLRSKISAMDSKLVEAEYTIQKLKEERRSTISEKETSKQEMAILSRKGGGARIVRVGFPPLFVCTVALISLAIGFMLRA